MIFEVHFSVVRIVRSEVAYKIYSQENYVIKIGLMCEIQSTESTILYLIFYGLHILLPLQKLIVSNEHF